MVEKTAFENGQISNFEGLVTLPLDWVILHAVVHQSSTSTYMSNFTEIKETLKMVEPVQVQEEEEQVKAELHHTLSHVTAQLVTVVDLSWII